MSKIYKTINNLETIELGRKIGSLLSKGSVVLLSGDLGAGKTTLTKGIGQALGIKRVINSPTFTLVKEYNGNETLYHLDLYRINDINEDFDLEEYFSDDAICVCEWPKDNMDILKDPHLKIEIYRTLEDGREIHLIPFGDKYEKIVGELDV